MVHRRNRHAGSAHFGCDLYLGSWYGGDQGLQLHADGPRLHCGLLCYSLCAHSVVLQAQPGVDLRLSGATLRWQYPQERRVVLLYQQDAGSRGTFLCRVRDPAAAGVLTAAHPLCRQRHRHHCPHFPLHPAGRRQDRHLDRYVKELLPDSVGCVEHLFCRQGSGLRFRRSV